MLQSSGGGTVTVVGPDFELPDEILSVIPTDPYEQLDLARKITSMALASRVSKLESEVGRMRHRLHEKDQALFDLEDRFGSLERAYQEAQARLNIALDDNVRTYLPTCLSNALRRWLFACWENLGKIFLMFPMFFIFYVYVLIVFHASKTMNCACVYVLLLMKNTV